MNWIPDSASQHCLICSRPFTFCWRRHHCRVCGILACGTCAPRHSSLVRQCTRCSNKAPLLEEEEEVEDKIEIKQEQEEGESFEKAVESIAKKESYTKSIDRAYLAKTKQMIRDLKNNRVGSLDLKRYERSVQKKMSY